MFKRLFLMLTVCMTLFLVSCGEKSDAPEIRPGEAVIETQAAGDPEKKGRILIEDERITITSLEYWQEFNHDGNFSDNCLLFLRNFIENDAELYEFNTVHVSDWVIIRDPKQYGYDLAFHFTVTESGMDTLPTGRYETIVKDSVDCYMTFSGKNPTDRLAPAENSTEASAAVSTWLEATYSWYMPEYGTADIEQCICYFSDRYADGNPIPYETFAKLCTEKLGVTCDRDALKPYLVIEKDRLYVQPFRIGGNTTFLITGEEQKGEYTAVTVQFFADCNRFILSDIVEYRIGPNEELLGCTVQKPTVHSPYGLRNAFK